jgi:pimeloyl-ACP methyl ester carboxylesterase
VKYFFVCLFFLISCFSSHAQGEKFTGIWEGVLDAGVQKLKMVFSFSKNNAGKFQATIQAPEQSALHIPADTVIFAGDEVRIEKKQFQISFTGKLQNDTTLSGYFVQGASIPFTLKKVQKSSPTLKIKRPQTPVPPFAYKSIEVIFKNNRDGISLAGTLTLPDTGSNKYPALVLISGSGAQDRDETILGHKPFAVLADHLTKKGFAVLRVDDRGVGRSTGKHAAATSADFAEDTRAAVNFLKTNKFINAGRIGLIGHSEGGMIAPMVAASSKDITAIVLLAGPGIPCLDLMAEQNIAILLANGSEASAAEAYGELFKKITSSIIRSPTKEEAIARAVKVLKGWEVPLATKQIFEVADSTQQYAFASAMVGQVYNPWFKYFLEYDPAPALRKLSCSVLALNGSRDIQVLPVSNLAGIKTALKKSKSKQYEVKEMPQLNHLFQTCTTCTVDEYAKLEESFSPAALEMISNWLLQVLIK